MLRRLLHLIVTTVYAGLVSQTDAGARRVQPRGLRIVVNIPAVRLDVFVADSLVRTIPIAVGMPAFKSPRGERRRGNGVPFARVVRSEIHAPHHNAPLR